MADATTASAAGAASPSQLQGNIERVFTVGDTPVLMFHKPGVPNQRYLTAPDLTPGTGPGKTSWPQSELSVCEQGKATEIACIDRVGNDRLVRYTIANGGLVPSFHPFSPPVNIGSITSIDVSPAGQVSWAGKVTVNGKDRGAFVVAKPNGQVLGPFRYTAGDVLTSLYLSRGERLGLLRLRDVRLDAVLHTRRAERAEPEDRSPSSGRRAPSTE